MGASVLARRHRWECEVEADEALARRQ